MNLSESLNFSTTAGHSSARKLHNRGRDIGYYADNLALYCANNDIDLSEVEDSDYDSAILHMAEFGSADPADHYYFWIE